MNTPKTFQLGWALFAGCWMTGAGIGYLRALDGRKERADALPGQVAERNAALDKLEAKWRAEGSKKFKTQKPPGAGPDQPGGTEKPP